MKEINLILIWILGYLPQYMQILFKHIVNIKITEFFF